MGDPMSLRAYARRRGVSPVAVSKAVSVGRLRASVVRLDGIPKIGNAEVADYEWDANTRDRIDNAQARLDQTDGGREVGYVYFVRCETPACSNCGYQPDQPVKVGFTYDLEKRFEALRNGNPYALHLIHTLRSGHPRRTERLLHELYLASARLRGEWFANARAQRLVDEIVSGNMQLPDVESERDESP